MPIRYEGDAVRMEGVCAIEEVDGLLAFLERTPSATVSLEACEHLHTAVLQALLAYDVKLVGEVYEPFLWKWVAPLLGRAAASAAGTQA